MYLKLDEDLREQIESVTSTDYDFEGDMLLAENIEGMLKDLLYEIYNLQEKYNDLEQDLINNYKPISYVEEIGYSEKDFY